MSARWAGLTLVLAVAMVNLGCPNIVDVSTPDSPYGRVVVDFGAVSRAAGIPAGITAIDILVKGADMDDISATLTTPSLSATLEVPAGSGRTFDVIAKDSSSIPIYHGQSTMNIEAGAVHELNVTMALVYPLSYNANGATGGTVPLTLYREAGATLTAAANSGSLVKTGFGFAGWNTQADGLGTDYPAGAALMMPGAAFTLYAKWGAPSTDATLSALAVTPVPLAPTFLPAIHNYNGSAASSVPTITVTPTANNAGATIEFSFNGSAFNAIASAATTGTLTLDAPLGTNTVQVKVTAQDGATVQTYTVTIAKTVMVTITPAGMGGTVTPPSSEFTPGQNVALNATPDQGYRFIDWTVVGGASVAPINGAASNLIPPVTTPSWVTANFAPFNGGDGSVGTPYEIATLDQLKLMNSFRSSHFKLTVNLDLASEINWLPIGDATTKFTGSFDGNGKVLSNLTINTATDANRGLFGYVDGAVISNVSLTNINFVDTHNCAGGLIGTSTGATQVAYCTVTGSITAYQSAGGLIGQHTGGALAVTNCSTNVSINTYMYGSVGGLIGYSVGGSIQKSYAVGAITESSAGNVNYVGGLVGWNQDTTITDCYAQGNVTGTTYVGGLVGRNSGAGTEDITNCYSKGLVNAVANGGGLVGANSGAGIVTSSYYDTDTSGQTDNTGKGVPYSTALLKAAATHASTYSGWDFLTIWDAFIDGSYPTLRP